MSTPGRDATPTFGSTRHPDQSRQGIAADPDWSANVALVLDWVTEHRAELLAGTDAVPAPVESLNVPTCVTGTLRDLVEVPVATDAAGCEMLESDCEGTPPEPADDIGAFTTGFPSLADITPVA